MPKDSRPVIFPPGEFIQDELNARNWTAVVLSEKLRELGPGDSNHEYNLRMVREILAGKRAIDGQIALSLAKVFGTSANLWAKLQDNYDSAQPF